jgi:hypothetical protein
MGVRFWWTGVVLCVLGSLYGAPAYACRHLIQPTLRSRHKESKSNAADQLHRRADGRSGSSAAILNLGLREVGTLCDAMGARVEGRGRQRRNTLRDSALSLKSLLRPGSLQDRRDRALAWRLGSYCRVLVLTRESERALPGSCRNAGPSSRSI